MLAPCHCILFPLLLPEHELLLLHCLFALLLSLALLLLVLLALLRLQAICLAPRIASEAQV